MARMANKFIDFLLVVQWIGLCSSKQTTLPFEIPGLTQEVYTKSGDINLGVLQSFSRGVTSGANGVCNIASPVISQGVVYTEAIAYAVSVVNRNSQLLPNISLGFVILDSCRNQKIALVQSLRFLPVADSFGNITSVGVVSSSSSAGPPGSSNTSVRHYDVVGMLGPTSSDETVPVATLMSAARVPVVGYRSTSTELSDKTAYPYFLRVSPSDLYQVLAMLHFIRNKGWTYISVLYQAGYYGETAMDSILKVAAEMNICIATSLKIRPDEDMNKVLSHLITFPNARVVILFIYPTNGQNLLRAVRHLNVTGHFIWICSSTFVFVPLANPEFDKELVGAFFFMVSHSKLKEFEEYFLQINPQESRNPWLKKAWGENSNLRNQSRALERGYLYTKAMDAVLVFAHGLHQYVTDRCQGLTGPSVRQCIKGEDLLPYLQRVDFAGYSERRIRFDETGDVIGTLRIDQLIIQNSSQTKGGQRTTLVEVALYNIETQETLHRRTHLTWQYFIRYQQSQIITDKAGQSDIPASVCTFPCSKHQYKVPKKLSCCWECRSCRVNERLVNKRTQCEACPVLTWPDPASDFTTCLPITPTYPQLTHTPVLVLLTLGILGLVTVTAIIVVYIIYNDQPIIKASSRELSFLHLMAVALGYITVLCIQMKPTDARCSAIYWLMSLSYASLYASLLVKVVRIYRIFHSAKTNQRRLGLTSPSSQLILSALLIFIQAVMCMIAILTLPPKATLTQPQINVKEVQLSCGQTAPTSISFLAYNLVLIVICSVFAFMIRKLPDNYNESRAIAMCVHSTLLSWLAFIPISLAITSSKSILAASALLLNHTVALMFLFLPKLYVLLSLGGGTAHSRHAVTVRPATTTQMFVLEPAIVSPPEVFVPRDPTVK